MDFICFGQGFKTKNRKLTLRKEIRRLPFKTLIDYIHFDIFIHQAVVIVV